MPRGESVDGVFRPGILEVGDGDAVDVVTLDRHVVTARLELRESSSESAERKASLHRIDPFRNLSVELAEVESGETYFLLDGWWGERAELVFDRTKMRVHTTFQPRDSTWHYPDGRKEVISESWDHEHCEICMQKIGRGGEPEGYRDQDDDWVCVSCYTSYVEPRSLAVVFMWEENA